MPQYRLWIRSARDSCKDSTPSLRRRTLRACALLLAAGWFGGCAASSPPKPIRASDDTYRVGDVSFRPPAGTDWFVVQRNDDGIQFSRRTHGGRQHTVQAFVLLERAEAVIRNAADLAAFGRSGVAAAFPPPRFRVTTAEVTPDASFDEPAVRMRLVAEDRDVPWAPGAVYVLDGYSLFVRHPGADGRTVVHVGFSERMQRGEALGHYAAELDPLLSSLEFTPPASR
jgi:hypothetical protein